MTNFATYIDSANAAAPIAQRGKAKQKRSDLRLVGLGLVVTRDGGVPLASHAYPGDRPDVTQFTTVIDQLIARHATLTPPARHRRQWPRRDARRGDRGVRRRAELAGQLRAPEPRPAWSYIGSVPPSDVADLLALPAGDAAWSTPDRFAGLTALETRRRRLRRASRRVVLTHSPTLHAAQARGLDQTLAKAERDTRPTWPTGWPAARPAATHRGHRRDHHDPRPTRGRPASSPGNVTGDTPATHRLTWQT